MRGRGYRGAQAGSRQGARVTARVVVMKDIAVL